jgi:hypothetical protein
MSDVPTITRRQPGPVGNAAGITSPRASARRVDITPELGIGMAGHGPDTDRAHGAMGRLWANVLVVDDGKHERVALITIDMMAGSRFLSERLAERVAAATGLSVERIFLAGSHTHRGPGWVWGNATYDRITATADLSNWDSHFDLALADALVARLVPAVTAACADLSDPASAARIGYATATAYGATWNRSVQATLTRPPAAPRPDPDPAPGKRWGRPVLHFGPQYVEQLHALLNDGMVQPPPPMVAPAAPPPAVSPQERAILDQPFATADDARAFLEATRPGLAAPFDAVTRGLADADALDVYRLAAAAPADKARELAGDLDRSTPLALVHDLLAGEDDDDTPPALKDLRKRWKQGDDDLTMDEILRALLDPANGKLRVGGFLGAIRTWVDGQGRWWDEREEKPEERRVTDCRLHAIAAFRASDDSLVGAFCTFGATPTVVGAHAAVYCGDGFAAAVDRLRLKLGDPDLAIGIAGGTVGDTNLCHPGRSALDIKKHRKDLPELLSILEGATDALGAALEEVLQRARTQALTDVTLTCAMAEVDPRQATLNVPWLGNAAKRLPDHAAFGFSTLAASDLGQSAARVFMTEELFVSYKNGVPFPPTLEEHLPKPQLPRFASDPTPLPVRVVRLDGPDSAGKARRIALAGLPAEISTLLGYEAARALEASLGGGARAFVAGPVGDYCSYFSTVWEYVAQHYEGASSPWGRWSGDWLVAKLLEAAKTGARPPVGSQARFTGKVGSPKRGLRGVRKMGGGQDPERPSLGHPALEALQGDVVSVTGGVARGAWTEPTAASRPLWNGPLVELLDAQGSVVRTTSGLAVQDVLVPTLVWCEESEDGKTRLWRWEMRLPALAGHVRAARVGSGPKKTLPV